MRKLCVQTPGRGQCVTRVLGSNSHVAVLIWRDTDEMPLKSSERADGKGIGRGEWSPASWRRTYVAASIWWVNPSGMLKKLRNTSSKQTFDSIYRYRQRETSRLKAALIVSREASCVLYVCTSNNRCSRLSTPNTNNVRGPHSPRGFPFYLGNGGPGVPGPQNFM